MPYTSSNAQTGSQVIFNINTGTTGSPTWTPISEVLDITQSGKTNKTADVTNLQSSADEFVATLQSAGNFDLSYNRVSSDAGQAAVLASFNGKTLIMYKVQLPKSASQSSVGDYYSFSAIVEELDDISSVTPQKQIVSKAKFKVSGTITQTLGS